ncbi:MAG: hypothetical protein AAF226_04835, partial [Verrucomicrobiota bacterium]
ATKKNSGSGSPAEILGDMLNQRSPSRDGSGGSESGATQSTGKSGRQLPEEFRSGLDIYFESLEKLGD